MYSIRFLSVCFITSWTFTFRCFASFYLRKRLHGNPLKSDALSGLVGGGGARPSRALHRRRWSVWGPAVSPSTAPKRGWHCRGLAPKWIRNIAFNLRYFSGSRIPISPTLVRRSKVAYLTSSRGEVTMSYIVCLQTTWQQMSRKTFSMSKYQMFSNNYSKVYIACTPPIFL